MEDLTITRSVTHSRPRQVDEQNKSGHEMVVWRLSPARSEGCLFKWHNYRTEKRGNRKRQCAQNKRVACLTFRHYEKQKRLHQRLWVPWWSVRYGTCCGHVFSIWFPLLTLHHVEKTTQVLRRGGGDCAKWTFLSFMSCYVISSLKSYPDCRFDSFMFASLLCGAA